MDMAAVDNYKQFTSDIDAKRRFISKEINELNEKVANTNDKYLADNLDEDDYKGVKKEKKNKLNSYKKRSNIILSESKKLDIKTKNRKYSRLNGKPFKHL
ncbi:hypothetical protein IX39_08335 [Chryseobacterium formosense]|uniref:Uncharacterized protein n=1 Tax=Chryseobacterium formosense TaxID=236814 RepID=A0A085Z865_9FLAO|nr:hypothetical protein [Chryseobacterium formosense]KFF00629.1 hypothetical protein IX39_08335 [Chryseobacterium formosense]